MTRKKEPPVYEWESPEYEGYISTLQEAKTVQNRRNNYTNALKNGKPNPFGSEVPPKPNPEQLETIKADREWKAVLEGRSDRWWFRKIRAAVEEEFYRAKIALIIWWDICEKQETDKEAWHDLFRAWDFEKDLFVDWDMVEYALHCCGFSPDHARSLAFEAEGRKRMKAQRVRAGKIKGK